MGQGNRILGLIPIVAIGILIQVLLVSMESRSTPSKTAVKFINSYFQLEKCGNDLLCETLVEDSETNPLEQYFNRMEKDAIETGHKLNYMRYKIYSIHSKTQDIDDNHAKVHITGEKRRYINFAFAVVAKIFSLGETFPVDVTIDVVKEKSGWKVCGDSISLL